MKIMNRIIPITICTALILVTACKKLQEELPVASFTVSPAPAGIGDTIYFQNTSKSANTFDWDFGDGNSSTEENPSHIYTATGIFTINLEVTNADGSDEASSDICIMPWTARAPMPTARWLHSTSVVDGKIYAIGGGSQYGSGALRTVEEYDPVTDTWTTKSVMPTARQAISTSVVDREIYAIGGVAFSTGTTEINSTVEEYNPATNKWTTKSGMPTARGFHSASVVEGRIYVIGGSLSHTSITINALEVYEPATDTWTPKSDIPRPIICGFTAVVDGKIYAIGGEGSGNGQRVDEYDPVTDTWTQKTNMPTSRTDLSGSVLDEKIYAIGGDNSDNYLDILATVEVYDPATDTWTAETDMPTARVGLRTSMVDGKIYAIGGLTNWDDIACGKVEVYNK